MPNQTKSIMLVAKQPGLGSEISAVLRSHPNVVVEEYDASLSELNGRAAELSESKDVIIFKSEGSTDKDVAAIRELHSQSQRRAILLALTSSDTTLADAQRLTRAGVSEVLPDTISADELETRLNRWTSPSPHSSLVPFGAAPGNRQGKIITVAQARGGIGATTVAVNLADHLLGRGGLVKKSVKNRVLLIDLDIQFGAIASFLDIEPNDALYQLAVDGMAPDAMFVQQSINTLPSGLSALAAPTRFAPLNALQKSQLRILLEEARSAFDYVVVDLPRALVEWLSPVLELSSRMLLVTDSTVPSIHQARRLIDFYLEDNPNLAIDIVVNHEKKPLVRGRHHAEAAKVLERPLLHWLADDPKAAREAVDRGVPLSEAAGWSQLNKSFNRLARGLVADLAADAEKTSQIIQ